MPARFGFILIQFWFHHRRPKEESEESGYLTGYQAAQDAGCWVLSAGCHGAVRGAGCGVWNPASAIGIVTDQSHVLAVASGSERPQTPKPSWTLSQIGLTASALLLMSYG